MSQYTPDQIDIIERNAPLRKFQDIEPHHRTLAIDIVWLIVFGLIVWAIWGMWP